MVSGCLSWDHAGFCLPQFLFLSEMALSPLSLATHFQYRLFCFSCKMYTTLFMRIGANAKESEGGRTVHTRVHCVARARTHAWFRIGKTPAAERRIETGSGPGRLWLEVGFHGRGNARPTLRALLPTGASLCWTIRRGCTTSTEGEQTAFQDTNCRMPSQGASPLCRFCRTWRQRICCIWTPAKRERNITWIRANSQGCVGVKVAVFTKEQSYQFPFTGRMFWWISCWHLRHQGKCLEERSIIINVGVQGSKEGI